MFAHLSFAMPQKYSFFALINKRSMKITLILNGKTEEDYLLTGISAYEKRLKHYIPFETIVIPALKNTKALSIEQQKEKEGELLFKEIQSTDRLILLDEGGKEYNSVDFSGFLQQQMNTGIKNLVFVVGGPYGFSDEVYKRANGKISLSRMTFSHQMVRLFFVEQLYRGMTILKNEPYHHQ
jgi:23S rRNA (pseudouridine1915-N3)-methyltransferase